MGWLFIFAIRTPIYKGKDMMDLLLVFLALYDVKLKVFKPIESLLVKHELGGWDNEERRFDRNGL
ncbi:hypothetical protein ACTHOQ_14065 [Solibacillus silvestris]|uniref:hypothetical protein n=1 Tax=Solibacillus silvestris TaxID=76853 RepID=UPI003F7FD3DF